MNKGILQIPDADNSMDQKFKTSIKPQKYLS